jgi:hypothetical protein
MEFSRYARTSRAPDREIPALTAGLSKLSSDCLVEVDIVLGELDSRTAEAIDGSSAPLLEIAPAGTTVDTRTRSVP